MIMVPSEVRKEVVGSIERFEHREDFDLLLVWRECPYCHNSIKQPVLHIAIHRGGSSGTTYICPSCGTYYYFVGDKIYQFIPEAQLLYLPNYVKKPSRLDTIKTYRNLYHRAKAFTWWEDIDLEITDDIIERKWTMPVEVAAQMMEKENTGKAPGYSVGFSLKTENATRVYLDSDNFMLALSFLKERGLVE